jgi:predicted membrane protein
MVTRKLLKVHPQNILRVKYLHDSLTYNVITTANATPLTSILISIHIRQKLYWSRHKCFFLIGYSSSDSFQRFIYFFASNTIFFSTYFCVMYIFITEFYFVIICIVCHVSMKHQSNCFDRSLNLLIESESYFESEPGYLL